MIPTQTQQTNTTDKKTIAKRLPFKRNETKEEITVHNMIFSDDSFFPKAPYDRQSQIALLDYLSMFHNVVRENQRKHNVSIYDALSSYVVDTMPRTAQMKLKIFDKYTILPQKIEADVVIINQKIVNCKAITASILLVRCKKFTVEKLICANAVLIESEAQLTIDTIKANCALLRCDSYYIGKILNHDCSLIAAQDECYLPYQAESIPPTERGDLEDDDFLENESETVAKNYFYGYNIISQSLNKLLEESVMGLFYEISDQKLHVMMLEICAQEINPQTGKMDKMITSERFLKAFTHLDPTPLLDHTIEIILDELMDEFMRRFKPELPLVPVKQIRKLIIYCLTEYLYARFIEAFRTNSDKLKKAEEQGKWNMNFDISLELQELKESGKTLEEYDNENEYIFYKDIAILSKNLRTRFKEVQFY